MRLFTALWPAPHVVRSLEAELAHWTDGPRLRWVSPERWHVTLGFFGDDDDATTRAEWLRRSLAGRDALSLRLTGGGAFPGVLWMGVDGPGLAELAQAAGSDAQPRTFHAHLTIARGPRSATARLARQLAQHRGPQWIAREVALVHSERDQHGSRYRVVERFPLQGSQ